MEIKADDIKKIDQKLPVVNSEENCTKFMYSVARRNNQNAGGKFQDVIGGIIMILMICYVLWKFAKAGSRTELVNFTKNQEITKLLISLMLLGNVKNLSNSLVKNIILPIIEPVLPFLRCNLNFKVGQIAVELGDFLTDSIIFLINLSLIYVIFVVLT